MCVCPAFSQGFTFPLLLLKTVIFMIALAASFTFLQTWPAFTVFLSCSFRYFSQWVFCIVMLSGDSFVKIRERKKRSVCLYLPLFALFSHVVTELYFTFKHSVVLKEYFFMAFSCVSYVFLPVYIMVLWLLSL